MEMQISLFIFPSRPSPFFAGEKRGRGKHRPAHPPSLKLWRHGGETATSPTPVRSLMLPPYYVFPNNAAINIGFDDGHAETARLASLWGLYWHYNWRPRP